MATRPSARERLVDAASTLFYRDGINATGIDRVIARAGVAKASLYNNFTGKDELVAAYLERRLAQVARLLDDLDAAHPAPRRVDAFLERLEGAARRGTLRGCAFANAAVEVSADSPARAVIDRFYQRLERFFADALGVDRDAPGVRQLVICYDGAMAIATARRDPSVFVSARALADSVTRATREE
ncbi:MAG: TetR/AcrR family transcriptional regulator [Acidimicrobiales bacterium]